MKSKTSARDFLRAAEVKLQQAGIDNARQEVLWIAAHFLKIPNPLSLYLLETLPASMSARKKIAAAVVRRARREPLAYILQSQPFAGLDFYVNRWTLVPRPETEVLVEDVSKFCQELAQPKILDVGTGSGAIAVSLAHQLRGAQILACDISLRALSVARKNARRLKVSPQIRFYRSDALSQIPRRFRSALDAVASNAPYISSSEMKNLPQEVRREPRLALDGGSDGFKVLRRIAMQAREFLRPGGKIFLEIGWKQAAAAEKMLSSFGFQNVQFTVDQAAIQRMISATWIKS